MVCCGVNWNAIWAVAEPAGKQYGVLGSGLDCNMRCCGVNWDALWGVVELFGTQHGVLLSDLECNG